MAAVAAAPVAIAEIAPACPAGVACRAGVSAAQVLDLAARMAAGGRRADAEKLLAGLQQDADGDVRREARFRLGLMKADDKDFAAAATQFRAILMEKPDATRVRLELARVLAAGGEEAQARRQLRQAQAAGLPREVATTVDRFQTALRSRRRLGASIEAGIAPDSNINRANGDATVQVGPATVTLDADAQARSGVGAEVQGQAFWRPRLAVDLDALATISVNADLYGASRFDDIAVTAAIGPELTRGRSRYRVQAIAGRRWFGGERYADTSGLGFSWQRTVGRKAQLQLDLSVLDVDYARNPAMSGWMIAGAVRYERALGVRTFARVTLSGQRQTAIAPAFAGWTYGGQLLLSREMGWISPYLSVGYYRTMGDAPFAFPPAARDDDLIALEGGLVLRRLALLGVAPVIRVKHIANTSPVFFYDFTQTRIEMALTKEF